MVLDGLIIKESLVDEAVLAQITILSENSWEVDTRADHQPPVWTALTFQADESQAQTLCDQLCQIIKPGWYIDFHSPTTKYIVYKDKVFQYPREDLQQMEAAQDYGYAQGIPYIQLEWNP